MGDVIPVSNVLEVKDLLIQLGSRKRKMVTAVNRVSFDVRQNKCLVIIGESGSGKSTLLKSLLSLIPPKIAKIRGEVHFQGTDLLKLSEREMARLRGNRIAMVFQGAMSVLDPVFQVGSQVTEAIRRHRPGVGGKEALEHAIELFRLVGIPSPEQRMKSYPHELSGGMRQRVMIAIALACQPDLLLADEPTTALDFTIQAQILRLLRNLQNELGMSLIMVTHDIAVASVMADEIAVMYAGEIVEFGPAEEVLSHPSHPYTKGLIEANHIPEKGTRLINIPGQPPDLSREYRGCAFAERCSYAQGKCFTDEPEPVLISGKHQLSKCYFAESLMKPEAAAMQY
jgi:oligopeptide/dipeptide ABC transporter ATP-binding protein